MQPFELQRYLGEWHEVARLDHSFERNLVDVTANYSLREDGGVRVINAGFNEKTLQAESVEGKAYFIGSDKVGRLKVSFFGPFYGSYNIAKLTPDYSMALVIGPSLDYAWILSRSQTPGLAECNAFFKTAEQLGIPRQQWIQLLSCQS